MYEGSREGYFFPWGPNVGNELGVSFPQAFQRLSKVCFGYGESLSMVTLRGEPGRGDPLLGLINDTYRRPW
jgi:hypothetical protein